MERAFSESFIKFLDIINRAGYHDFSDEIKEQLLAAQQYADMSNDGFEYKLDFLLSAHGQIKFAIRYIRERLIAIKKMREECDEILKKTFGLNVNVIEFTDPILGEPVTEIKLRRKNKTDIERWDELSKKIENKLIMS